MKIDCSFIQDIPKSTADMEIVQAIIGMGHTLHLQVVTEGVETQSQFELLHGLGCDFIQGYLLSPAVAVSDIIGVVQGIERRNPLHRMRAAASKESALLKEPSASRSGAGSIVRPIR